jgi:hypothetical protein
LYMVKCLGRHGQIVHLYRAAITHQNAHRNVDAVQESNRSAIQPNRQLSRNIANRQISPGQAYYGA